MRQPAVEALDKGILHGFARRDVVPSDAGVISPCQDSVAGEFAAIVADHHLWLAALDHQPVQFPRHPGAGERGVGHQRQALARAIIDHGKDAEATAVGKLMRRAPQWYRTRSKQLCPVLFRCTNVGSAYVVQSCLQPHNAEVANFDIFATRNPLESQERRRILSPISKLCAVTLKLWSGHQPITQNYYYLHADFRITRRGQIP